MTSQMARTQAKPVMSPRRLGATTTRSIEKRTSTHTRLEAEGSSSPFALVDRVYDEIREAIREGSLKPGERLVERDLAERLGVSRTPVREAFRLLQAHGLASVLDGRGLVVRSLDPSEVAELYFAWESLEGLAARTAAQYATDLEIESIQQVHAQWDISGAPRTLGRINNRFHASIHVATHNRFLMRALRSIDDCVTLLGLTTYTIPGRGKEVAAEHGAIVTAIAARDQNAAEAAARRHIRRAGQLRMALTAEREEADIRSSRLLRGRSSRRS
jgi:DNA-binding GntR family transcriptional regulator